MKVAVKALRALLDKEREELASRERWRDRALIDLRKAQDNLDYSRRAVAEYEAAIAECERKDRIERLYGSADVVRPA